MSNVRTVKLARLAVVMLDNAVPDLAQGQCPDELRIEMADALDQLSAALREKSTADEAPTIIEGTVR